jgi:hypothetical protein
VKYDFSAREKEKRIIKERYKCLRASGGDSAVDNEK